MRQGWRHVDLGKVKINADVYEQRELPLAGDELRHEPVALVEATKDVQHQSAVLDGFVEVSESISHGLHLATVVVDGERAPWERVRNSASRSMARDLWFVQELFLKAEPSSPIKDVSWL
jgi:hypothetical protein